MESTEVDKLKVERQAAYKRYVRSCKNYCLAKKLFANLEKRYLEDKKKWERADRKLAMIDGRLKILAPAKEAKKTIALSKMKAAFLAMYEGMDESERKQVLEELGAVEEVPDPCDVVLEEEEEND